MIKNIKTGEEIKKFIFVVATGRSGSNMMIDLLNHIEGVNLRYELKTSSNEKTTYKNGIKYIRQFLSGTEPAQYNSNYFITGCKLLDTHIWMCDFSQNKLKKTLKNIKFVHLYRENILKQYISYQLAILNNKWIHTNRTDVILNKIDGKYEKYNLSIDIKDVERFIKSRTNDYELYKKDFPSAYKVDYESLAEDYQKVFDNGLFDYLEVPRQQLSCNLKKQNTRSLEEIIENYDEVKEHFPEYFIDN